MADETTPHKLRDREKRAIRKLNELHRRHKTRIHFMTIGVIGVSMFIGGELKVIAEVGFLALSVMCELP